MASDVWRSLWLHDLVMVAMCVVSMTLIALVGYDQLIDLEAPYEIVDSTTFDMKMAAFM